MTDKSKRIINIGMGAVGVLIVLDGLTAPLRTAVMTTIPVHHLLHAGMAVGAGLLAMSLAANLPRRDQERSWWVLPAVLAPMGGLFLMWPSEYANLMKHPALHFLDHLGIAVCSLLAVFGAQAYVRGLGWPMLALLVGMDAAAAGGFGVSPGPSSLLSEPATTLVEENSKPENAAAQPGQPVPLHVLGQRLSQNLGCTACHHVDGGKAVGPTWKNLAGYPQTLADGATEVANYQFLTNAILYPESIHLQGFPAGVMPSSYRAMLSGPQHPDERDLNAIIWYINTLSDRGGPASLPPVPDEPKK